MMFMTALQSQSSPTDAVRVHEIEYSEGKPSYILMDRFGHVVQPVDDYLSHLTADGVSPTTVRSLAYDLRDLWVYLDQLAITLDEVAVDDLEKWIGWLRLPPELRFMYEQILLLDATPACSDSTVARKLSTVVGFFEYRYGHGAPEVRSAEPRQQPKTASAGVSREGTADAERLGGGALTWGIPSATEPPETARPAEEPGSDGQAKDGDLIPDDGTLPQRLAPLR
jgi:hypothetical protein